MSIAQRGKIRQNSAISVACYIEFKIFQQEKKDDKTRIYENVCWWLNAEKHDKTRFHEDVCRALSVEKYDKTAPSRPRAIQNLNHFNAEKKDDKTRFMRTCEITQRGKYDKTALYRSRAILNLNYFNTEKGRQNSLYEEAWRSLKAEKIWQNSADSITRYTEFKPFQRENRTTNSLLWRRMPSAQRGKNMTKQRYLGRVLYRI